MSRSVNLGGTAHILPTSNECDWGLALSNFLAALPQNLGPAFLQFGSELIADVAPAQFLRPGYGTADATEVFVRVPKAGKLSALYVQAGVAATGVAHTITVRKNGSNTSLAASLVAAATQAAGSDPLITVTVAAGDRISVSSLLSVTGQTPATGLVVSFLYSADA